MAVAGIPPHPGHAGSAADMGLAMLETMDRRCGERGITLGLRVGLQSGPVMAGVIGHHRVIYDLWGDTVNTASRMESGGVPGRVQVTEQVRSKLGDAFDVDHRGEIPIKGKGPMNAYLLRSRRAPRDPGSGTDT
jgi:class 3 adenylate cyclase